ncbi:hypothetical protein ABT215_29950 [Streptomyces sp900105755]|uniref:SbtR family transcriptional regulator n=1 Tax=Streptomyces sp. 900105755 TaxID=3154389 RepID=UPI0033192F7D
MDGGRGRLSGSRRPREGLRQDSADQRSWHHDRLAAAQIAVRLGARVIASAGKTHADALRDAGTDVVAYGDGLGERVTTLADGPSTWSSTLRRGTIPELLTTVTDLAHIVTMTDFAALQNLGVRSTGMNLRYDVLGEYAELTAQGSFTIPVAATQPLEKTGPTREALVEAVYQDQVRRLTEGADHLLATHPPAQAMRRWMDLFSEWLATKNGMIDTLRAMINNKQLGSAHTRTELLAVDKILAAGRSTGDISAHATSEDVAAGLIGILTVVPITSSSEQAARLLDIFMNGISAPTTWEQTLVRTRSG